MARRQVLVQLSDQLVERLDHRCEQVAMNRSEAIRQAIEAWLRPPAPPPLPRSWGSEPAREPARPASPEGPGGPLGLDEPEGGVYEEARRGW